MIKFFSKLLTFSNIQIQTKVSLYPLTLSYFTAKIFSISNIHTSFEHFSAKHYKESQQQSTLMLFYGKCK